MPRIVRRNGATKTLPLLLLAALVIAGLIAAVYFGRAEPEPIFVPRPVTFAPGLHMLGELSPSVAYVVETSEGLILIDTGLDEHHRLLLKQLQTLGLDVQDLKMILVTHGHGDHYLGALTLQQLTGAKLYAGQGDSHVLRDAGPREAVFSTFPMDHVDIHATAVDVELVGGETIELGDARIQAIATPGHTPGSMCYLLERDGRTALFTGDTIMTITGDLGTYSTYLAPRYRGDPQAYLATLQELARLPVPDLLLPGHPRVDRELISARVTPSRWASMLDEGRRNMEELTRRYATDGADFLDGNPKELLPRLHYLGDVAGIAMYCLTEGASIVLFDAPGGTKLVDVLGQRFDELGLDLTRLTAVVVTSPAAETAGGLTALQDKTGCQIIAAQSAHAELRARCPDAELLLPQAAATAYPWLPLQAIPIAGFGRSLTAFTWEWEGRRILVSGGAPLRITRELMPALGRLVVDRPGFLQSLNRLQRVEPALWLPAKPKHGQNANLYDPDWQEMFRQNQLLLGMGVR